jgi:polar amino acid transport system permease protein
MNIQYWEPKNMNLGDVIYMLRSALMTIELSAVAIIGGLFLGVIVGVCRASNRKVFTITSRIYLEIFRGIPILLQIFLFYYGLRIFDVKLPALLSASLAFIFNVSANVGETLKGIILSIPRSQYESAASLGLPYLAQMWFVILPQVARAAIPPTIGITAGLVKDTSLASIIGFVELTQSGTRIMAQTMDPYAVYPVIALIYFFICFPLTLTSRRLERKLKF